MRTAQTIILALLLLAPAIARTQTTTTPTAQTCGTNGLVNEITIDVYLDEEDIQELAYGDEATFYSDEKRIPGSTWTVYTYYGDGEYNLISPLYEFEEPGQIISRQITPWATQGVNIRYHEPERFSGGEKVYTLNYTECEESPAEVPEFKTIIIGATGATAIGALLYKRRN